MCVPPPSPSCAEEAGYIAWYEIKAMIAAGAKVGSVRGVCQEQQQRQQIS